MHVKQFIRAIQALLLCGLLQAVTVFSADTLVTPNPSPEAQSLMAYLGDVYGKKILSGQHENWQPTNSIGRDMRRILDASGKLPAILSMDVMFVTRTQANAPSEISHATVERAINWYARSNGIVTLCWHWYAPLGERAFYTKDTAFDISRAVTEGTPEYEATLRDMNAVADELKLLQEARVPVLWRPLHEANGRWFWWGAGGPEPMKKLWRLMFERFTAHHRLNNLIWVFSPGAAVDLADWYPGDSYVDIIGQDHYPLDGNHAPAKDIFDELNNLRGGSKLIGMSENGPIPDPERLVTEKANWLFFITWAGRSLTENNSAEELAMTYKNPHLLNLGDLPDLKTYPFGAAGKAVRLGFSFAPTDVAVGSPWRSPPVVAVQDSNGRTVREGSFEVTVSLSGERGGSKFTATTVNGIAEFPNLKFDEAGNDCVLVASADGLSDGRSPAFQVGPVSGLVREWWTLPANTRFREITALTRAPQGRDLLGTGFESPVQTVSNFVARTRGYLLPPLTGTYRIWIANQGLSELWLSTDSSLASKLKIAEVTRETPYSKWPHTHEAESGPVELKAGERYYIELLQKQPSGSSQLAVRWRLPNGVEERPVPGVRLSPFDPDQTESNP